MARVCVCAWEREREREEQREVVTEKTIEKEGGEGQRQRIISILPFF